MRIELRVPEIRVLETRAQKVRVLETRPLEIRLPEIRTLEICPWRSLVKTQLDRPHGHPPAKDSFRGPFRATPDPFRATPLEAGVLWGFSVFGVLVFDLGVLVFDLGLFLSFKGPFCNFLLTGFNPLPSTKRRESREGLIHECPPGGVGTVRLKTGCADNRFP